jgi:hypothetical protein
VPPCARIIGPDIGPSLEHGGVDLEARSRSAPSVPTEPLWRAAICAHVDLRVSERQKWRARWSRSWSYPTASRSAGAVFPE